MSVCSGRPRQRVAPGLSGVVLLTALRGGGKVWDAGVSNGDSATVRNPEMIAVLFSPLRNCVSALGPRPHRGKRAVGHVGGAQGAPVFRGEVMVGETPTVTERWKCSRPPRSSRGRA